jgi:hypothetical protein
MSFRCDDFGEQWVRLKRHESSNSGTAAQKSKSFIAGQIDRQARTLGRAISQTVHDLEEEVGSHLRQSDTISSAAQVANWAARYVAMAGTNLQSGDTDRFIADLETFGRQRPWAVAAAAALLGFVGARVIKSSSVGRYQQSTVPEYPRARNHQRFGRSGEKPSSRKPLSRR